MSTTRTREEAAEGGARTERFVTLPVLGEVTWAQARDHVADCIDALVVTSAKKEPTLQLKTTERAYQWASGGFRRGVRLAMARADRAGAPAEVVDAIGRLIA